MAVVEGRILEIVARNFRQKNAHTHPFLLAESLPQQQKPRLQTYNFIAELSTVIKMCVFL